MASQNSYTATCRREGTFWTVRIAQLDRTTRAARLTEVEAAARRLIAAVTGADPDTFEVVVDLRVPEGLSRLLDAAAAARQEADVVSVPAVALRRTLARRLTAHGYGVRDLALLLGVSHARAKQLAGGGGPGGGAGPKDGSDENPAPRPHGSYQHEAFFYRSDEEFLAGTVPFLQDAVALGQPVMVVLVEPRMRMLRAALGEGPESTDVHFVDMEELGSNPARIIPAWLDFVQQNAGRPVRGIGEPQWPGRRPEEVVECQLHEGLLNVAIDPDIPLWLRCPYDVTHLAPAVAQAARLSHPALVEVGSYRGSTSYGGLDHVDSLFRSELPAVPADSALVRFGGADLNDVRAHVTGRALAVGLDRAKVRALTSAVAEVAGDSIRHGGGGELRTWIRPNAVICQVTDPGGLDDPLAGRRTPGPDPSDRSDRSDQLDQLDQLDQGAGRGLWRANQISDLVQVRSTERGSTVRVFAWR